MSEMLCTLIELVARTRLASKVGQFGMRTMQLVVAEQDDLMRQCIRSALSFKRLFHQLYGITHIARRHTPCTFECTRSVNDRKVTRGSILRYQNETQVLSISYHCITALCRSTRLLSSTKVAYCDRNSFSFPNPHLIGAIHVAIRSLYPNSTQQNLHADCSRYTHVLFACLVRFYYSFVPSRLAVLDVTSHYSSYLLSCHCITRPK